jgi:glycogen debranching enzyme
VLKTKIALSAFTFTLIFIVLSSCFVGLSKAELPLNELQAQAIFVLEANTITYGDYRTIISNFETFPIPYGWDEYFHGLASLYYDADLTKDIIQTEFDLQNAEGLIPHAPTMDCDQDLNSQPPLLADLVLQYYQCTGDVTSLRSWYPKLIAYYKWMETNGSPYGNIGISPFAGRRVNDDQTAFYIAASTGMDNSPVYDSSNGKYDKIGDYYYFPIEDVLLTTAMALFAKDMAIISSELDNAGNYALFNGKYVALSNFINTYMWDDTAGLYRPINSNLAFLSTGINTVQTFLPLIAQISSPSQASRLVEHLINVSEYNLGFGIPSVALSDPSYYSRQPSYFASPDPSYWRGPIWAPTTYLVYKGLLNYGYKDVAIKTVAQQWLNTVNQYDVNKTVVFAEYYNSYDGSVNPDGLTKFSWTAAVTLMFAADTKDYFTAKYSGDTTKSSLTFERDKTQTSTIAITPTLTPTLTPTQPPVVSPTTPATNMPANSPNMGLIAILLMVFSVPIISLFILKKSRKTPRL